MFKLTLLFLMVVIVNQSCYGDHPIVAAYVEGKIFPPSGNRPPFAISMIDPHIVTDIIFAFAGIGYVSKSVDPENPRLLSDFSIQPLLSSDEKVSFPQLRELKKNSNGRIKLFLSVGGWSFNDPRDTEHIGRHTYRIFSLMASTARNRKEFIDSAIVYLHRYSFDGLDIDWEFPGQQDRGGSPDDFDNYLILLKECAAALHQANPSLLLSIATPPFVPYGIPNLYQEHPSNYYKWLAECAQYVDRVNVMTYDFHTPFDIPKITGVNSPLKHDTNPASSLYIAKAIQNYLDHGIPAQKIVLGLPAFGHSYAGVHSLAAKDRGPGKIFDAPGAPGPSTRIPGFLAFYEVKDMIAKKTLTFGVDQLTNTAMGYNPETKVWVSFDTPETNKLKAEFSLKHSLGGIMCWAMNLDEYYWEPRFPIMRAAWEVFYSDRKKEN